MRKKEIEKAAVKQPKARRNSKNPREWTTTVQQVGDTLVFNVFKGSRLIGRHCVNPETGEHANWMAERPAVLKPYPRDAVKEFWSDSQIGYIYMENRPYDYVTGWGTFQWGDKYDKVTALDSKSDELLLMNNKAFNKLIKDTNAFRYGDKESKEKQMLRWRCLISDLEDRYDRNKRMSAEERRVQRVQDLMARVPEVPKDFNDWIYRKMFAGVPGDALYDGEDGWYCSECHLSSPREDYKDLNGNPAKVNKLCICPECGAKTILHRKPKRYTQMISYKAKFCLVSEMAGENDCAVIRHFDAEGIVDPIYRDTKEIPQKPGKILKVMETIRVVMYKQNPGEIFSLDRYGRKAKGKRKAFVIKPTGATTRQGRAGFIRTGRR